VSEETPIRPANPYASSKVAAEVVCRQWARTRELDVVIARPFNHTGAGQRPDFVLAGLARQLAAVRLGRQPARVLAGDLDLTRDFLDVRDVLKAYLALLAHGEAGETYNVCSGREVHLGQTLGRLIELAGVEVEIATDAALLRPAQQRRMRGSHHKITVATGWTPAIALDETLQELLAHWTRELDT
jgi:GDP-4-dehydro-6-deoxy-D-mannose reductase